MLRLADSLTRAIAAATFTLSILLHTTAGWCEFPVDVTENSGLPGNFFQTSGYLDGTVFHLAFIRSADGNPPFKVYYAPIDASADFNSDTLTGDTLRLKDITLLDLTLPAYVDGRSPSIFPLSDNGEKKAGVAFIGDGTVFFALINPNLDSDALQPSVEDVQAVPVVPAGSVTSLSSASDSAGNLHLLYDNTGSLLYASIPFDDFTNSVTSIPLDSPGTAPQLAVKSDPLNNAHAVWAGDDGSGNFIAYYAMADFDSADVPGKILIPKTRIFGQEAGSFTAPWLSVTASNRIYLSATESADPLVPGTLYLANVNPNLAPRDGTALVDPDQIFSGPPTPLGIEFSNPVILSDTENRIHISGTGGGGTGLTFASAVFSGGLFSIAQNQKPVSLVDLPEPLDIFDRSALAYFSSGKAVVAWSGIDAGSGENHIFAISTPAPAFPPQPQDESGCTVNGRRPIAGSGVWDTVLILASALFFFLRSRLPRGGRKA